MFPERLRALRKGQKITLKELATHLNENLGPMKSQTLLHKSVTGNVVFGPRHTLKHEN